jgi:hypothetical protein
MIVVIVVVDVKGSEVRSDGCSLGGRLSSSMNAVCFLEPSGALKMMEIGL